MAERNNHSKVGLGIERRSKLYFVVGNVLVGFILMSFLAFMTRHYFQNTLWKDYYYKNAFKFSDVCTAQFTGSEEQKFPETFSESPKKLDSLPHPRGFFDSWDPKTSPYYHAKYTCDIRTADIRIGKGVNYMHIGWIFGETIEVTVGGRQAIEIQGDDFVSFPVTHSELSQPLLSLQILVSSTNRHRFGLASILPPVITTETKDHFAVLGIQPIYEMVNVVLPLIPAIVLGVLLGFAWLIGLKTRIVLSGMFYFVSVLFAGALPLLIPYVPFSATKVYTINLPMGYLAHLAVFCLMLEVFGFLKTKIYPLMNSFMIIAAFASIAIIAWDGVFPYSQAVAKGLDTVLLIAWIIFGFAAIKATLKEQSTTKRKLFTTSLMLVLATIYRFAHDISRHMAWNSYVSIDFYYSFAMPLFIAGIVFYYLSILEAQLKLERDEKRHLKLGKAASQDLLSVLPNSIAQVKCSFADVQWDSALPSAHSWQAAWLTKEGNLLIVCGQLNGTDDIAALGQVAVQAALIQCQEQELKDPSACLHALNGSLSKLFHNYVRSDAVAVMAKKNLSVSLAIAGQAAVQMTGLERHFVGSSAPLGSLGETRYNEEHAQTTQDSKISFHFSDENGDLTVDQERTVQIKRVA